VHIQNLIENCDPCLTQFQSIAHPHLIHPLFLNHIHPNMRIQCNLLSLFLLGLVVTSIVEASGGKKLSKKKKVRKVKGIGKHPTPSSILLDNSAVASNEVPVLPVSTTLDSSFQQFIDVSSSSSSSSSVNESNVAQDVIKAVEQPGFGRIKSDWWKWQNRKDLFDEVVTKSVVFIVGFIKQVEKAKRRTLAALFIKRSDKVDQVLEKIDYNDDDLTYLTIYRPELAESHDNFFNVLDKIKNPRNQELAVEYGVYNLFKAEKHASVIPLINALENRQFNGMNLKNVAIQSAFSEGAVRGSNYFVERLHEHPVITSEEYVDGLSVSWVHDKSKIAFQFLLTHADQDDLERVKEDDRYKQDQELRKAIDDTFESVPPVGTRHLRLFGRAKIAITTLNNIMGTGVWMQEPGSIIASYLLDEQEGTNMMEKVKTMPEDVASYGIKQEQSKCIVM
jgi:hypothetical protein